MFLRFHTNYEIFLYYLFASLSTQHSLPPKCLSLFLLVKLWVELQQFVYVLGQYLDDDNFVIFGDNGDGDTDDVDGMTDFCSKFFT